VTDKKLDQQIDKDSTRPEQQTGESKSPRQDGALDESSLDSVSGGGSSIGGGGRRPNTG
jgi:hypothetical protein